MIHLGHVLDILPTLPEQSVQCVVTSPPYLGLRDYGLPPIVWPDGWEGSLGLEPTPDLYVAHMVEVFRAVRRVLRDDGTLWVNLGDSYCSTAPGTKNAPGQLGAGSAMGRRDADHLANWRPSTPPGLKPKDLVGIPWMVAKALQAPYYTGRIKSEADRIWLACAIEAEGCIFIHKRKAGQSNGQGYERQNDSYGSGLEVANTSEVFVRRCLEIAGAGSICHQDGFGRKQRLYRWNMRSNECRDILREVYPYFVAKQQQARLAIGCPSSGERAQAAHEALIGLHRGSPTDVDFPAPTSLYEPGYYLRSDIIWSKLNPMPESVTDRPTKAHEYLFLLSKRPTYYYDAEAIKEPDKGSDHARSVLAGQPSLEPSNGLAAPHRGIRTAAGRNGSGRNRRTVWTIPTQPYPEAHFATFPEALVEPCILAGSKSGDTVLDPFAGSGTTLRVAIRLQRVPLGIDLNPTYGQLAAKRTNHVQTEIV